VICVNHLHKTTNSWSSSRYFHKHRIKKKNIFFTCTLAYCKEPMSENLFFMLAYVYFVCLCVNYPICKWIVKSKYHQTVNHIFIYFMFKFKVQNVMDQAKHETMFRTAGSLKVCGDFLFFHQM